MSTIKIRLRLLTWLIPALFIACQTTPIKNSISPSIVEVTFDGQVSSARLIHPIRGQSLRPEQDLTFTRIAFNTFDHTATNTRYMYAQFSVISANQDFDNLTLYAYNQSQNNIAGTAIKNLVNFNDVALTDPQIVQSIKPTHRHVLNNTVAIDADHADFQGFTPFEAQSLENQALTANTITATDDLLEYGFVARNSTGGGSLNRGESGTITLAVRFLKDTQVEQIPQKFSMTFILANEVTARSTRDVQSDSTSATLSRHPSATPFLIGTDDVSAGNNRIYTPNLRISSTPSFLLEPLLTSTPLGQIDLAWDTNFAANTTDSSGSWKFTPLTYGDIDHTSAGYRYLTATFRVEYMGSTSQSNLHLRAMSRPTNIAGSAIYDLRLFPNLANPEGEQLLEPTIVQNIYPLHAMQLGVTTPVPDSNASGFQAYLNQESNQLTLAARTQNFISNPDTILDYGYQIQLCNPNCNFNGTFTNNSQGLVSIAVRIPRNFSLPVVPATIPPSTRTVKPFKFKFSFIISSDNQPRVSRAIIETTSQAQARADTLGSLSLPSQMMLLGTDTDTTNNPKIYPIRLKSIKIANNTQIP